ncbi:hypothetical protein AB0K74_48200 [Streptomyces sp. NPDC056159]|uniref:hypothetical protein n=1 Tax=Streptomyces sp. NPDC056159 TaxID=3155537 RepID=UPI00343A7137
MDRPKSRLIWLRNPNVVRLLRGLATGSIPLTHDGLHQETPWRTVVHLRDLLMDGGVLPRVDRQLLLYQRWLAERLAIIEDPEHRRLLQHFATWHQMRRLRSKAEKGPLGRSQTNQTKQEITQAGAFLAQLAGRGRTIERCQQADLDAWHTEKLATRRPAQTFLRWCMRTGRMPRLALPPQVVNQDQTPLHQHHRLAVLRRVLNDDSLPLRARIAAALVLLYAQPVTRIVRLTTNDVIDDGTTVTVRLGDPPSPLPEPVGYVGVPHGGSAGVDIRQMFNRNVAVRGGVAPARHYIPALLADVLGGVIDPSPVFDRTVELAGVPEGYKAMDAREALKVKITF